MALSLLAYQISDLCLGKPPLTSSLSAAATVSDAIAAFKSSDDPFLAIWTCSCLFPDSFSSDDCRCVGKLCMADIMCFLAEDHNLSDPRAAVKTPIAAVASSSSTVRHVQPCTSLVEAIEMMVDGAQNLVVQLDSMRGNGGRRRTAQKTAAYHKGRYFCWITQEDVVRFLLGQMGLFSPIPAFSVDELGVINTDMVAISYHSSAMAALPLISGSVKEQTAVAIVDEAGGLVGEISPLTVAACDQTAGEMMAYIDCGGPPEELVGKVKLRMGNGWVRAWPEEGGGEGRRRRRRGGRWSSRIFRRGEGVVCSRDSSLAAVMVQAVARRVSYVWVVEDDGELVGIVKFSDMLKVFVGRR